MQTAPASGPASHTPWTVAARGITTGPTPPTIRSRNSKSPGPHSPPGQSPSLAQGSAARVPPTHVVSPHVPPGQSLATVHGSPALVPASQAKNWRPGPQAPAGQSATSAQGSPFRVPPSQANARRRRATRSTVSGASADPKSVASLRLVGSSWGSKTGGSKAPSGAYEATKDGPGILTGPLVNAPAVTAELARRSRGTGTRPCCTRIPRQSIGKSRLPAWSTANRASSAVPVHGGAGVVHSAWKSFGGGSAVKWPKVWSTVSAVVRHVPSRAKSSSTHARSPGGPVRSAQRRLAKSQGSGSPTLVTAIAAGPLNVRSSPGDSRSASVSGKRTWRRRSPSRSTTARPTGAPGPFTSTHVMLATSLRDLHACRAPSTPAQLVVSTTTLRDPPRGGSKTTVTTCPAAVRRKPVEAVSHPSGCTRSSPNRLGAA